MSNNILLIIVFIAIASGAAIGFGLMMIRRQGHKHNGLLSFNAAARAKRTTSEEAILKWIDEHGNITNNDVEKLVGVSDATASRYLKEMEGEKKIVIQGEGRGIFYKRP